MIIDFSNINGGGSGSGYTLPVATSEVLGGVKVGSGLSITSAGTLSADAQPIGVATTAETGVVKIEDGGGISVDSAGTISFDQSILGFPSDYYNIPTFGAYVIWNDGESRYEAEINTNCVEEYVINAVPWLRWQDMECVDEDSDLNGETLKVLKDWGFKTTIGGVDYTITFAKFEVGVYIVMCSNGQVVKINSIDDEKSVEYDDGEDTFTGYITDYNIEGNTYFYLYVSGSQDIEYINDYDKANDGGQGIQVVSALPQGDRCYLNFGGGGAEFDFDILNYDYNTEEDTRWVKFHSNSDGDLYIIIAPDGEVYMDTSDWEGTEPDFEGSGENPTAYTLTFDSSSDYDSYEVYLDNVNYNKRPAGYVDGSTVLLETIIPEKIIDIVGTENGSEDCVMTAIGLTNRTRFIQFNFYSTNVDVYINTDHSMDLYDSFTDTTTSFSAGTDGETYIMDGNGPTVELTIYVTERGAKIEFAGSSYRSNAVTPFHQHLEEKQVLYTWSDNPELTADIDYTSATNEKWIVRYKYSEIPDNTVLVKLKYSYNNYYFFYVWEDGALYLYSGTTESEYNTLTRTAVPQYTVYRTMGYNYSYAYWTDDEVIIYCVPSYNQRLFFNIDDLYRIGWHKELEHKIDGKAFYRNYVFYDGDYGIITEDTEYNIYSRGLRLNPSSQYNNPYTFYTPNNSDTPPFFAPTTTAATADQLCVSAQGWAAPSWKTMLTLLGIKSVWRGTEDQYDAIGTGNYDSDVLYIIVEPNV